MTVSDTDIGQTYNGNGSNTDFAINFDFQTTSQIKVAKYNTLNDTFEILGSGFTFIGGPPVTTVRFTTAPLSTDRIKVYRQSNLTQETDYVEAGPFPAEAHEEALDTLTMMVQEIDGNADKAVKLPLFIETSQFDPSLPNNLLDGANKIIAINEDADGFVLGPSATEIFESEDAAAASAAAAAASETAAASSATSAAASAAAAAASAAAAGVPVDLANQTTIVNSTTITIDSSVAPRLRKKIRANTTAGALTANISNGGVAWQELFLIGMSADSFVTLQANTNLSLNGEMTFFFNSILVLHWDSVQSMWLEVSRRI